MKNFLKTVIIILILICTVSILNASKDKLNNLSQVSKPAIPIEAEFKNKIVYTANSNADIGALKADCEERKGVFNECGSPCENKNEGCITVCAYTCEWKK